MIEEIKIKGYKSIRDLELSMKPINILIGANGVGKSNFISFFKLINNIYEQRLQQFSLKSGVDNLLHFGRKYTNEIVGKISFHSTNAYMFVLFPSDNGNLLIKEEDSFYKKSFYSPSLTNENLIESNIINSSHKRDKYLRPLLSSFKIYHFHDTSITSPLRASSNINDNRILKEDGSNLAAFLYYLNEKHKQVFKRLESIIKSVIPDFDKFSLEPDKLDENRIRLVWNEINHPDSYFDANHFSDGSLRFIALTTLFMQAELPSVIIVDEPELGLHPLAINKLSEMIKSVANRGCQVIVSTQSVNLINNFLPEDIITVDRKANESSFKRLSEEQLSDWLEDYSLGELWLKNVIEGQAY